MVLERYEFEEEVKERYRKKNRIFMSVRKDSIALSVGAVRSYLGNVPDVAQLYYDRDTGSIGMTFSKLIESTNTITGFSVIDNGGGLTISCTKYIQKYNPEKGRRIVTKENNMIIGLNKEYQEERE